MIKCPCFKKISFLVLIVIVINLNAGCCAEQSANQHNKQVWETNTIFSIEKTAVTKVDWRNEPLIARDDINYLGKDGFGRTGKVKIKDFDEWQVVNTISDDANLQYRKEIGIKNGQIELNIQMNLPSYENNPNLPDITYSFYVPIERLSGMRWRAITGRSSQHINAEGELTAQTPNGSLVGTSARWIAFESDNKKIVFDLNPKGVSSYHDFGPGDAIGLWNIHKTDGYIKFSVGGQARIYGGVFLSKVVIFEGTNEDFKNRHSQESYQYYNNLPPKYRFSFATSKPQKDYTPVDATPYDNAKKCGWENPQEIKLLSSNSDSIVYNAVASDRNNTFLCDIEQPGLYIVTIQCSGVQSGAGPFSVVSNSEPKAKNLAVQKGKIKTITYSQWLGKGVFKLAFEGNWLVSSIALQMLLHKQEDFAFNRGYWIISDEYEPTLINSSKLFERRVNYKVAVSEIDIPEKIIEPQALPKMSKPEIVLPDKKSPKLVWRYNAFVGGLGTSNSNTFLEFETPEKIVRRIEELKTMGIDTIIVNGLLARHCHKEHLPMVEKKIKQIVQIAHKMGVRVLDHQDLTIIWNKETALRNMIEQIDYCQRTVAGNLPNQSRCPLNPDFQKEYFAYMKDFIDQTDVDGLMLDEVCFHGENFCGCEYCRQQFTRETGLVMPVEENSSVINNMNSRLWKSWCVWRTRAIGDWWVSLRKIIQKDHPDFCIMGYMTAYGFQDNRGTISYGYDLFGMARSNDFLGTEIMERNVMDNCRGVFAGRKLYNMLRLAYGGPIFGLVYSLESEHFAYFGWAMNNMNGQATWSFLESLKSRNATSYIRWNENMDKMAAQPVSETALVFSKKSRDWAKWQSYYPDVLGMSQILTDRHIQHDVICEENLNKEYLEKYRLVILPSMCCISDAEITILKDYVKTGGHLLITGHTATLDDIGETRKVWGFADIAGVNVPTNFNSFEKGGSLLEVGKNVPVEFNQPILKISLTGKNTIDTIINVVDKQGVVLAPVAVSSKFGKGEVIYCAPRLGAVNYQQSVPKIGGEWTFELNKPLSDMLINVVRKSLGEKPLSFEAKQIPQMVFATVYRQNSNGRKSTLVHLLNGTGVTMKRGDILASEKSEPAFPPLKEDLVFEISLNGLSESFAASPDYEGHKPISTKKLSGNRYLVTVPKDALKKYSILYFNEN